MNILLTTDAVGGIWRYAVELSHGLAKRGHTITLAIVGPPASQAQTAELHPRVRPVQTNLPLDWLAGSPTDLDHASTTLAGINADIALLHAPALLRHRWPIPVAIMAHSCLATWFEAVRGGPVPPDYAWRADASAAGFHRADAVAAPTEAFAAAIRRIHGLPNVTVVHNGRTPLAASAKRDRAVLTAGRLWDDGKGTAVLDRIAPRLSAPIRAAGPVTGPGTQIHLPHLDLLGSLGEADLATAYASASVFASPARYEPFGLAVLEAAQAGMALVLSDIATFRELWDGVARFVPPEDDDAWLAALEAALDDPAHTAQARAARYTADAMVQGTAALLARIAA